MSSLYGDLDSESSEASKYSNEDLLECNFCEWHDIAYVHLDAIRAGANFQRSCCGVLLDAITTWYETIRPSMTSMDIRVSVLMLDGTIRIHLNERDRSAFLLLYRSQDSHTLADKLDTEIVDSLPKWAEKLMSLRMLHGDTSSIDSLRTLESWLSTCDQNHSCLHAKAYYMPERVIEITHDGLFLREGLAGDFRYACLSHCWGAEGLKCKLMKGNKINLCQGFVIESLPKTFRDAVQICLRLGIRFLWIDALCIVQDDINDWNQTAAAMADIYRQAYITIAATASQNSSGGCFRSTPPGAIGQNLRKMPGLAVREMRWPDNPLRDEIDLATDYPLLQRAWVFQERRMSPRMVHFTSTQLVWECGRYIKGEDGAIIKKQSDQGCSQVLNADELTSHIRAWQETLNEYTGMGLTLEQDRLPAIAAVAVEEAKRRRTDTYIAGMWIGSLLNDILWHRSSSLYELISDAGLRPKQLAPSWSWASVKGRVWFHEKRLLASVKVVNFSFTPSGPPQMGGYKKASITLRGPYTNATFRAPILQPLLSIRSMVPGQSPYSIDTLPPGIQACGSSVDFDFLDEKDAMAPEEGFSFIFISTGEWGDYSGLVLRRLVGGVFERVGCCMCNHNIDGRYSTTYEEEKVRVRAYVESLPVREVTIV